jgi:hypothetical protein
MIALLSLMTSFALIALGLGLVAATLRGSGARIVLALAGQQKAAAIVPLPPRPRAAARITVSAFRALPPLRAAV